MVLRSNTSKKTIPVFVYGSLRKGHFNDSLLQKSKFKGLGTLKGYAMYDLGAYPCIYLDKLECVVVEYYEVPLKDFGYISSMEIGAGYRMDVVKATIKGEEVEGVVYTYRYQPSFKKVMGGDWNNAEKTNFYKW